MLRSPAAFFRALFALLAKITRESTVAHRLLCTLNRLHEARLDWSGRALRAVLDILADSQGARLSTPFAHAAVACVTEGTVARRLSACRDVMLHRAAFHRRKGALHG